jgi:CHAT domain-containing protein/tetratricopeptide (TPR) repeat protein
LVAAVLSWALLAGAAVALAQPVPLKGGPASRPLTAERRTQLLEQANALLERESSLHQAGRLAEVVKCWEQLLAVIQDLYPEKEYPDGHPDLAQGLNNLGFVLDAVGRPERALPYFERALTMYERLYPEAKYPDGHPDLAASLQVLGIALEALGRPERALPYFERALAMCQKLYAEGRYPDGHADLATTISSLGHVLEALGRPERALPYHERALAMRQKLYAEGRYPDGHPDLAASLQVLGLVLEALGRPERALPYFERALAMRQKLYAEGRYPDGHADLAITISSLGYVLEALGRPERALPYCERALAMYEKLYPKGRYPDGHHLLATGLHNLGHVLGALGRPEQALPYCERALAMYKRLYPEQAYPDGRRYLAVSLHNLGFVLEALGRPERALPYHEQALAMNERLYPTGRYPDGHPDLAQSLYNLGSVLQALGRPEQALPYCERALAMSRRLSNRQVALSSEATAFGLVNSLLLRLDAFLSLTRHRPEAEATYAQVWATRAGISRILEHRHLATRLGLADARTGPKLRKNWEDLLSVRRQLGHLLQQPAVPPSAERDRRVTALTVRKDRLESDLARAVPELAQEKDLARRTPDDLAGRLPADAAFIDLFRYVCFEFDPARPGLKGKKRTPCYVAFLVAPGSKLVRVELGEAAAIDEVVTRWRQAIYAWRPGLSSAQQEQQAVAEERRAATRLRRLVWQPLAKHLPPGTKTIYLAPDGDLARVPWAALPGGKAGTVLLEEYALAVVPHGPFLLRQRLHPPRFPDGPEPVLAVGDVAYGPAPARHALSAYAPLPGTAAELKQLRALAGGRPLTALTGADATTDRLLAELPRARYLLLATHGFFDAEGLTEERRRQEKQLRQYVFLGGPTPLAGQGARSPLVYTGLVLAGANRPEEAPDGGILTGEALLDRDLGGLRLAVLSACDTGLGELTGGEGVQGLVRAFHLAGCPDVVASLWQVNDRATAALMAKFYHGLWAEKKSPLEALRQAQLTLYYRPDLIPALAGERGPPRLHRAVAEPLPADSARPASGRAPTRLWAAFVLSGLGR